MSIMLDRAAINAAKTILKELITTHADRLAWYSLPEAIMWLERQLPTVWTVTELLTWATASEETAAALPSVQALWKQALQTEGYTLRIRARCLTQNHSYI